MIQFLVFFKNFLSNFFLSTETIAKSLIFSQLKNTIPQTSNKTLWILANGPSLKRQLTQFENKNLSIGVVNYFGNHDSYPKIQPKYYFLQAPEFWIDDVLPSYVKNRVELFNNLATKTDWNMELFIPYKFKNFQKNFQPLIKNNYINIHYYNDTPVEGFTFLNHYYYNNQWGMPRPHNILIPSIMLGLYMNFKKIYILGADHSWLPEITVDENNNALLGQKHFYDPDAKAETMKKLGKGQRRLFEILHKFYLMFKGYFDIEKYAIARGAKIINLTPNSYIDAFQRGKLEEVLKLSKKTLENIEN